MVVLIIFSVILQIVINYRMLCIRGRRGNIFRTWIPISSANLV